MRASRDLPPALLVGTGGGDLAAARVLGRRGVPVWLAAPRRLGSVASRHTRGLLPVPEPGGEATAFADVLLRHARRWATRPVLIAVDDLSVEAIAEESGRLAERFRLTGPPPEVAREILDKARQYARVESAGLPLPRTWAPGGADDAAAIAAQARFPLLVKGRSAQRFRARYGIKAIQVETPEQLADALRRVSGVIVQELVPGGIERVYEHATYADASGRVLASAVMRKLDEEPRPYGSATAAEALRVPELEELGRRLLRAFEYRGLAHSEWKLDPRDGVFRFVELNPRIPVSAAIQAAAGADTIWPAYADALGLPVEPVEQRPQRVVWLRPELRLARRRALAPPRRLPDSPAGPTTWVADLFDLRDPGPLLWEALASVKRRLGSADPSPTALNAPAAPTPRVAPRESPRAPRGTG